MHRRSDWNDEKTHNLTPALSNQRCQATNHLSGDPSWFFVAVIAAFSIATISIQETYRHHEGARMQGRPHSTEPIAEQHSHCLGMSAALLLITYQCQLISAAEKRDALAAVAAKDKEGHEKPGSI